MTESRLNTHGGDIYKASELYGIRKEELLDFSANINPLGVPAALKELMVSNMDQLVHYPDPDCIGLSCRIAQYLDIQEEHIIVGNGASEIIFLLFEVLNPKRVLIPAPSFSEYAEAAKRYGTDIRYFELREQDNFRLDMDGLLSSFKDGIDAVILCNPNNPTSTLIPKADLARMLEYARAKGITVILDEAFIELTEGGNENSMASRIKEFENLFVIRAFTKYFAIPGLRLGYGLGSPDLINRMWKKKIPWSVNTFACLVGEFLGMAEDYMRETSQWIASEKKRFYRELKNIKKLKVFAPDTNFVLVKILEEDISASGLKAAMASKGILIRDASNFKFLNDKFFRLAIKDRESNDKVIKALSEIFI